MARKPYRWEWSYRLDGDADYTQFSRERYASHFVFPETGQYDVRREIVFEDGTSDISVQSLYVDVTDGEQTVRVGYPITNALCVNPMGNSVTRIGGSTFPVQYRNMQPITVTDDYGNKRHIGFDLRDRKMYELFTDHGIGREIVWKDTVGADLSGGDSYISSVKTRGATGGLLRYFLEPLSVNITTKASKVIRRDNAIIDSSTGYPTDASIKVGVIVDEKQVEETATQSLSIPRHEISMDKRVYGNVIQHTIEITGAPLVLTGITENLIAKDNLDSPSKRGQVSSDLQEEISFVKWWLTRGASNLNRATGLPVLGVTRYSGYGPDSKQGSAFESDSQIDIEITDTTSTVFLYWEHTDNQTANTLIDTIGDWRFMRYDGDLLTLPTGKYFDVRGYDLNAFYDVAVAIEYLLEDVRTGGNKNLPTWE